MKPSTRYSMGVRFGLLTGLLYVVLLFFRYNFFASNPLSFGIFTALSYLIILVVYLFTGIARKKELGGFADFRELFTSIFIAILITEFAYIIFNLVYFKFVDPSFWENFKATTITYMQKKGLTDEQVDQQMKSFKDVNNQTEPLTVIKGYGVSVIIDSIFGLIFAAILRKKKPVFEEVS